MCVPVQMIALDFRSFDGKSTSATFASTFTFEEVRMLLLVGVMGLDPRHLRISHWGKFLDWQSTIAESCVRAHSTVHVSVKLWGGMKV